MLKPGGSLSWAFGNLSAAAGSGGAATGASFAAASLPSGRPINGDPGGSAGAAVGVAAGIAAAGGGAAGVAVAGGGAAGVAAAGGADGAGCWAKVGTVSRIPAIVPASSMERRAATHGIIVVLPDEEALDSRGP